MSMSLYTASVPVFKRYLENLSAILARAAAHAEIHQLDQQAFLQARLAPDMLPLIQQVRTAADFALRTCAPLAGVEIPAYAANEQNLADLQGRIARSMDFIGTLGEQQINAGAERAITTQAGQAILHFKGHAFLCMYALPNFFFHLTAAFAILRHLGVDIGKQDFDGFHAYRPAD